MFWVFCQLSPISTQRARWDVRGQLRQVGVGFLDGAIAGIAGDARSRTCHRLLELRDLSGALPVHHNLNPRGEQFPVLGGRKLRDQRPLRVVHLPDIQPPTQAAQLPTVCKGNLSNDDERLGRCVWNELPRQRRALAPLLATGQLQRETDQATAAWLRKKSNKSERSSLSPPETKIQRTKKEGDHEHPASQDHKNLDIDPALPHAQPGARPIGGCAMALTKLIAHGILLRLADRLQRLDIPPSVLKEPRRRSDKAMGEPAQRQDNGNKVIPIPSIALSQYQGAGL